MGKVRSKPRRGQSPRKPALDIAEQRQGPAAGEDADAPLTPVALAKLLSKGGEKIQTRLIKTHIAAGAPADDDGRLTLAAYAAWLVSRINEARANGGSKPT